jgi:hypothetical protein
MGLIWAITALALVLLGRAAPPPREIELRIPRGTAREIAAGLDPGVITPTLSVVAGDVLVIENEDTVAHRVGPYLAPPGRTTRVVVEPSAAGPFLCTVHPSRRLTLEVMPRGLDLRLTALPTLLLGIPLAAVVLAVGRVLRALGPP